MKGLCNRNSKYRMIESERYEFSLFKKKDTIIGNEYARMKHYQEPSYF